VLGILKVNYDKTYVGVLGQVAHMIDDVAGAEIQAFTCMDTNRIVVSVVLGYDLHHLPPLADSARLIQIQLR
jgi:hypothetical protein